MKNITFNSKETYQAYRSAWKAEYGTLSAEIRTLRQAARYHQRKEFGHLALTEGEESCLAAANKLGGAGSYQHRRQIRSVRAAELLAELKEAKMEAQRQFLVGQAARAAARPAGV